MADSDGEYYESDDDIPVSSRGGQLRSAGPVSGPSGSNTRGGDGRAPRKRAAWEDIQRSWDTVVEGADGSINSTVEGLLEAGKRKRYLELWTLRYTVIKVQADYSGILRLSNEESSVIWFSSSTSPSQW